MERGPQARWRHLLSDSARTTRRATQGSDRARPTHRWAWGENRRPGLFADPRPAEIRHPAGVRKISDQPEPLLTKGAPTAHTPRKSAARPWRSPCSARMGVDPHAARRTDVPIFTEAVDVVIGIRREGWKDASSSAKQRQASLRDYAMPRLGRQTVRKGGATPCWCPLLAAARPASWRYLADLQLEWNSRSANCPCGLSCIPRCYRGHRQPRLAGRCR